jgi:AraC-like DNA-binding protein
VNLLGHDSPGQFITCLANTEQNLYFYINDLVKIVPAEQVEISIPRAVVTGPKFKPVGLLFGEDHLMIKVAFYPTGTYRLLGIDMQQTINTGIDAVTIWGDHVKELVIELQALACQKVYDAMAGKVFSFIEQRFDASCRPEEPIDGVAIDMLDPLFHYSLDEWASKACLSVRQFERNFLTRVGITPKLFKRIVRFEYAMRIKNEYENKSWSEIALECGYTDSSHLLREFKEFAEFPPSRFYEQPTSGYSSFPTG